MFKTQIVHINLKLSALNNHEIGGVWCCVLHVPSRNMRAVTFYMILKSFVSTAICTLGVHAFVLQAYLCIYIYNHHPSHYTACDHLGNKLFGARSEDDGTV